MHRDTQLHTRMERVFLLAKGYGWAGREEDVRDSELWLKFCYSQLFLTGPAVSVPLSSQTTFSFS